MQKLVLIVALHFFFITASRLFVTSQCQRTIDVISSRTFATHNKRQYPCVYEVHRRFRTYPKHEVYQIQSCKCDETIIIMSTHALWKTYEFTEYVYLPPLHHPTFYAITTNIKLWTTPFAISKQTTHVQHARVANSSFHPRYTILLTSTVANEILHYQPIQHRKYYCILTYEPNSTWSPHLFLFSYLNSSKFSTFSKFPHF